MTRIDSLMLVEFPALYQVRVKFRGNIDAHHPYFCKDQLRVCPLTFTRDRALVTVREPPSVAAFLNKCLLSLSKTPGSDVLKDKRPPS